MPNTVRIKRRTSGAAGAPSSLSNAELAYNEVDNVLYYGFGDSGGAVASSVQAIAGTGAFVDKTTAQTISGAKIFSALATCSATIPANDNSATLVTSSWVLNKIGSISSGVTTFNGRAGGVTLSSTDVVAALGFTPVNYSLPTSSPSVLGGVRVGAGLSIDGAGTLSANVQAGGVTSVNSRVGAITIVASDITPITDPLYLTPVSANSTFLKMSGGTVSGALIVSGNLTVNGTTTTVNAQNLEVADKNISLGRVATPTDATANGGGLTLLGTTSKSILWDLTSTNWQVSEHIDIAFGKSYKIGGAAVLDATTLGSTVVNSSLTKVGTITNGVWNGTVIDVARGGTGAATITGIVKGNGASVMTAAIAGVDYLSPSSVVDGGTF